MLLEQAADGTEADIAGLGDLLRDKRVAVLTGAGCSTESGIPDYRGPGTRARARNPMTWADFAASAATRRRYWARAMIGWERFSGAKPNDAHVALATLEARGVVTGVITQNVDRLHHAAGSSRIVELHGALAETRCTACGEREGRTTVQARLFAENPSFAAHGRMLPDGDAEVPDESIASFVPPSCLTCGGTLRPNVVLFGESVSRDVVDSAFDILDRSDVLLVVGSSLAVYSGYRFVRRAREKSIPIAIINIGPCRGEEIAAVRLSTRAGPTLKALVERLPPLPVSRA